MCELKEAPCIAEKYPETCWCILRDQPGKVVDILVNLLKCKTLSISSQIRSQELG